MDGLEREIEATIYDFNLNNMPAKRTAKRIMALIAKKDGGSKVPCSAGVIKPCPFCGNEALWYENENLSKGWGNYACTVCGAKRFPNASNKREGLVIWNARAL